MLLNFIRLDNFKLSILPHVTVEIFELLLVVRRDDAMSTKKALTGRSDFSPQSIFSKGSPFHEEKNALGIS